VDPAWDASTLTPATFDIVARLGLSSGAPDCLFNQRPVLTVPFNLEVQKGAFRQLGKLDVIADCDAVWGCLQFDDTNYSRPSSVLALASRTKSLASAITNIHDYIYKASGAAIQELTTIPVVFQFGAAGAKLQQISQTCTAKLAEALRSICPETRYTLKIQNINYTHPWFIWPNLGITNMATECMFARVPLTAQNRFGKWYATPDKFHIPKLTDKYAVVSFGGSFNIERTEFAPKDPYGSEMASFHSLASTWMVRPINYAKPRKAHNMVMIDPTTSFSTALGLYSPVCFPSVSIANIYAYAPYFPISPDVVKPLVDPIVLGHPPRYTAWYNRTLSLAIPQSSPYFATIARMTVIDYDLRLHIINKASFTTQQVADQNGMGDDGLNELMGF